MQTTPIESGIMQIQATVTPAVEAAPIGDRGQLGQSGRFPRQNNPEGVRGRVWMSTPEPNPSSSIQSWQATSQRRMHGLVLSLPSTFKRNRAVHFSLS